jgi:tetratricopeptide (TPR) repeat protein
MCRAFLIRAMLLALTLAPLAGCSLVSRSASDSRAMVASRGLSQRGITAIEQQDWATAENLLSEAVKVCSACPEARRYYAETLWHKGDRAGALEQLAEALKVAPNDATLWVRQAEMKLELGRVAEARADADQAIDVDPNYNGGWIVRAHARQSMGELREALGDYHRALACDGSRTDILVEIAELYRQMGNPQRALMNLQSVAETYPPGGEPARILYLSGLAQTALGRYDDALVSYRLAAERGGPDAELSYRSAEALWLSQQPDAARNALAQALSLNPEHAPSRQLLGQIDLAGRPIPPAR